MTADDTPRPARLPPLDDVLERAVVVALPLATRFRGVTVREAMLVEGPLGWAEWSPFVEYGDAEASTWLEAAIEAGFDPVPASAGPAAPGGSADVADASRGVRVNATVPAVAADRVAEVLARFDGCRTAKVKVAEAGQSLDEDVARVAAVREAMGPAARLRVDANAGWGVDEAVEALAALAPFGLEYAEQPVPGIEPLAEVRRLLRARGVDVPIAADEAVRKASDPLAVARAGAADVVVVKAQPLGGVRRALEIVRAAGLPATVSSALDTSIGLATGARLAALVAHETERFGGPAGGFDAGLGTGSLFTDDVCVPPLRPRAGRITLDDARPDPEALRRLRAPADRDAWWRERLARCHAVLAQRHTAGDADRGIDIDTDDALPAAAAEIAGRSRRV